VLCALAIGLLGQSSAPAENPLPDGLYTEITTEAGVVVAELFYQKTPMTVANHVGLAEGTLGPAMGQPFYDGLAWHRVVANFVVQGGDGTAKAGRLGYSFPDEIVPGLRHDGAGTLQMANGGPDTNGSQFCFMLSDQTGLNYNHTVFGKVVRGLEVLPRIKQGDTMKVRILRIGEAARGFKADEAAFKEMTDKAKKFDAPKTTGPETYMDDPDGIVGVAGRGSNFLQVKLANFERFTGQRIVARVYAHTPAEAAGEKLDGFLQGLAARMKVDARGALVVYLQDQDRWIVRVGKDSEAAYLAGPRKADGTKGPAAASLAEATEALVGLVKNVPAAAATAPATGTGRGGNVAPGLSRRLSTVLDNLIFRLEPAGAGG
jgi:cyclophilin family peptidyl-prolyl cis-trans isomerase